MGWLAWLALAAVWFATVQVRPLFDPDEGRYAEIPREMLVSGDWITPRLNGLEYFEKPPLQYWATTTAYQLFGISEWTSRLWSVGLAFGCLPLVFGWTTRLFGRDAGRAALLALAVSPYFVIVGHLNLLDAGFTFWLTGAVFAFALAQCAPTRSTQEFRWMLVAWGAAALAVLSKGIVVGVLAGISLAVYSLVERDLQPWKRLHCAWGIPLFSCIAAPWFIAVSVRNPDFPNFFFVHEHFARYLTTVHQRAGPWWYFIPLVVIGALPWIGSFVRACVPAWTDQRFAPQFKPLKFVLIFAATTFVFFSASGSKLAPYVLPMMPPLAAVLGAIVAKDSTLVANAARIGAAAITVIAVGLLSYTARRNGFIPHEAEAWAVAGALAGMVGVLATWEGQHHLDKGTLLATAGSAVLGWQFLLYGYSVTPPARSARDLVEAVRSTVRPETALFSVGEYRETLPPYLRRTLTLVDYGGELEYGAQAEPGRMTASSAEFISRWRSDRDAIAFFAPSSWAKYRRDGLSGRVIAADDDTIAVRNK